jgi:integrase/recombinase XerD
MIDDMRMRKMAEKTQTHYLLWVRRFAVFLGRSPDTATVEDLRRYQLHLVDHGTSPMSLNAAISGLKFFFDVTLDLGELMAKMQPVPLPRRLPVVLSRDEVARLLAAAHNLKHQTALSVAYAAGLRVSEVVGLKVTDIDSQRMTLHIEQRRSNITAPPPALPHRVCPVPLPSRPTSGCRIPAGAAGTEEKLSGVIQNAPVVVIENSPPRG